LNFAAKTPSAPRAEKKEVFSWRSWRLGGKNLREEGDQVILVVDQ